MRPVYERTPHLVDLVAQAERLAALLPTALDSAALDAAAMMSVRLDGSKLDSVPDLDVLAVAETRVQGEHAWEVEPDDDQSSLWVDPMGYVHRTDDQVIALEFVGVRAALEADDIAAALLVDPIPALAELHRRLTRGLVDAERSGELRITKQVVHDASVGRILFYPADPSQIPGRLASLAAWLVSDGAREHALICSGVLHHELLAMHPFEAANGRLARTAARLVLRSRSLDPGGRGAVESAIATDPLGYLEEVARTTRRQDLTIWLERWGEYVVDGLRHAARAANVLPADRARDAEAFAAQDGPDAFTIADFRADAGGDTEVARARLASLLDAGAIRLVPGTRGLRFTRA